MPGDTRHTLITVTDDEAEWARHCRDLDAPIRAAIDPGPDDVPVSWVVLVATRSTDGGGDVLRLLSNPAMPAWEVKGILLDALDDVRNPSDE